MGLSCLTVSDVEVHENGHVCGIGSNNTNVWDETNCSIWALCFWSCNIARPFIHPMLVCPALTRPKCSIHSLFRPCTLHDWLLKWNSFSFLLFFSQQSLRYACFIHNRNDYINLHYLLTCFLVWLHAIWTYPKREWSCFGTIFFHQQRFMAMRKWGDWILYSPRKGEMSLYSLMNYGALRLEIERYWARFSASVNCHSYIASQVTYTRWGSGH